MSTETPTQPADVSTPAPALRLSAVTALEAAIMNSANDPDAELPKMQRAYRMHLAGKTQIEISEAFGVCRQTIARWLRETEERAARAITDEPIVNEVLREAAKLTDIEQQAREGAANTESSRAKSMFLAEARRAAVARQNLFILTGIFPKAPEKIYQVIAENKVQKSAEDWDREGLTTELTAEGREYILEKMLKGRELS